MGDFNLADQKATVPARRLSLQSPPALRRGENCLPSSWRGGVMENLGMNKKLDGHFYLCQIEGKPRINIFVQRTDASCQTCDRANGTEILTLFGLPFIRAPARGCQGRTRTVRMEESFCTGRGKDKLSCLVVGPFDIELLRWPLRDAVPCMYPGICKSAMAAKTCRRSMAATWQRKQSKAITDKPELHSKGTWRPNELRDPCGRKYVSGSNLLPNQG